MVSIADAIGLPECNASAVLEYEHPGGSHKDRPAHAILKKAIDSGDLQDGMRVVEYTSGSMGISIAKLCRGTYQAILCMPENISQERERLIRQFNAELILTPADRILTDEDRAKGLCQRDIWLAGTRRKAEEIRSEDPDNTFLVNQSDNFDNLRSFNALGHQILEQHPDPIDYFVCCVGTGATWAGVTEVLKARSPQTRIIAIDAAASPTTHHAFYGLPFDPSRDHKPHRIPGVGAGKLSEIAGYGLELMDKEHGDRVELVSDEEVHAMCRELKEKGFFVGPTSGADALVSRRILSQNPKANVVTIFFDKGDRYLSTGIFNE